jgi:23S rRNA pseudouridine955/2504/2580 synthase
MKNCKVSIVYEDESCIVFDKAAGLAVQGGKGIGVSLDSILEKDFSPRPLLVHRLDRETSGLILCAKNKSSAAYFSKVIASRAVRKIYIAVSGRFRGRLGGYPPPLLFPKSGIIKTEGQRNGKAREAATKYKITEEWNNDEVTFTQFELELCTGRMHQIRISLSQQGYPILGDTKYGDFALNKVLRKTQGLKNMLLHSSRLIVPLPDGATLDISAPLPEYFASLVSKANR